MCEQGDVVVVEREKMVAVLACGGDEGQGAAAVMEWWQRRGCFEANKWEADTL